MKTEGIKYAGSKNKLIPLILGAVKPLRVRSVLDGFAGTTRVSQALKRSGYTVFCNDIAVWTRIFGECYLLNRKPRAHYAEMISHLNNLPGENGWFTANYGGEANGVSAVQTDGKKRIWQKHNTQKLDAVRNEIEKIAANSIERSVLLTSLILAMDKVDSSLGHQASYLRNWSARSFKTMKLEVPAFVPDDLPHKVSNRDVFDVTGKNDVDLAYFDPPYGSSNEKMPPSRVRYASYYHLWKTICLNDRPKITGAANRRADASDTLDASVFEEFRRGKSGKYIVVEAIERLLRETSAKYILLSYSSGGRATFDELGETFRSLGFQSKIAQVEYRRNVMAGMRWTDQWAGSGQNPREYLFLLSKEKTLNKIAGIGT